MDDPKFNKALVPLERHKKRADEMAEYFGITNRYSAGCLSLDQYLGGGYGRRGDGYEIVLLYGASGRGKSIFGLNMMLDPIIKGERVGLMILEDDPADVVNRLRVMTNGAIDDTSNVFFAEDQSQGYTLDQALQAVEEVKQPHEGEWQNHSHGATHQQDPGAGPRQDQGFWGLRPDLHKDHRSR